MATEDRKFHQAYVSFPPIPFPRTSLSFLSGSQPPAKFMLPNVKVAETAYIVMAIMADGENGRSDGAAFYKCG